MQWYSAAPLAAGLLLLAHPPAHAKSVPAISKVTFTAAGSTYNGTVTGSNFGAAPAGVPCNPCSLPEFSITDLPNITHAVSFGITAWSNTSITLTDVGAGATDAVTIALRNDALKNVAAWGGNMPGRAKNPKIKKVTFSGSGQTLQITITGKGFGSAPAGVPGTTDIPYFNFIDWNVKHPMQYNNPWAAGWNGQGFTDTVTLNYVSWSDTQIVIGGFAGVYGTDGFEVTKNDPYEIWLWQPPGINPGSTGPQTAIGGRVK